MSTKSKSAGIDQLDHSDHITAGHSAECGNLASGDRRELAFDIAAHIPPRSSSGLRELPQATQGRLCSTQKHEAARAFCCQTKHHGVFMEVSRIFTARF